MQRKPQDLLEFLRRARRERGATAPPSAAEPTAAMERTPRMLVLRRSHAVAAACGAGVLVVLALLLGIAVSGDGDAAPGGATGTGVWVLRVISFSDSQSGRENAATVARDLEKTRLDEVTLQHLPSQGRMVVTLGAWLGEPSDNPAALALRKRVRELRDQKERNPFEDADFWRIQR